MNNVCKWLDEADHERLLSPIEIMMAEAGWRAALKWVIKNSQSAKSLYMIDVNLVDEELRNGSF